jgi:ribonuclease BN (tRNA processing enzyme)
VLVVDGRPYLIDCGIGTIRRMVRANISSADIRTIFFTHLHADHALGFADLIANDYRLGNFTAAPTINVYGPPETAEFTAAAVKYVDISFRIYQTEGVLSADSAHFVAHEFSKDGVVYQDDKIRVISAENTHYVLMPPPFSAQTKSYAYRFETPYGAIVFTGDTGPSDAVTALAKGADVLVTEASLTDSATVAANIRAAGAEDGRSAQWIKDRTGHFTMEHLDEREIGEMATKASVKTVLLHHFNPDGPAAYVAGVRKYFAGPVFAGADLQRYCLGFQTRAGSARPGLGPCK